MDKNILCIDPGKNKIGICILNYQGEALKLEVISEKNIKSYLKKLLKNKNFFKIILGNGTGYKNLINLFHKNDLILMEEKYSSEEARKLYFKINPPKGLKKIIPLSLQTPKENIDSYAAWILGLKWLKKRYY